MPELPAATRIYLTTHDLAKRWGVSERTIYRWAKEGIPGSGEGLPYMKLGRRLAWTAAQVSDIEAGFNRPGMMQ
jgi:excisionase family DNA binding protein